jgi:hypothetical protein
MKVINHKEFACFEYESAISTKYSLGDILFRYPDILCDEKPEVGVIIQLHDELEFRTDMWGNSCDSDLITFATQEQIKNFRPQLLNKLN